MSWSVVGTVPGKGRVVHAAIEYVTRGHPTVLSSRCGALRFTREDRVSRGVGVWPLVTCLSCLKQSGRMPWRSSKPAPPLQPVQPDEPATFGGNDDADEARVYWRATPPRSYLLSL